MAETVKTTGQNAALKMLADQIIKAQQAEIAEMQANGCRQVTSPTSVLLWIFGNGVRTPFIYDILS